MKTASFAAYHVWRKTFESANDIPNIITLRLLPPVAMALRKSLEKEGSKVDDNTVIDGDGYSFWDTVIQRSIIVNIDNYMDSGFTTALANIAVEVTDIGYNMAQSRISHLKREIESFKDNALDWSRRYNELSTQYENLIAPQTNATT